MTASFATCDGPSPTGGSSPSRGTASDPIKAMVAEAKAADVVMAVVDEGLGSLDGDFGGLFLPEYVLGSRVLLAKEDGEFELDNTSLLAEGGPTFGAVVFA